VWGNAPPTQPQRLPPKPKKKETNLLGSLYVKVPSQKKKSPDKQISHHKQISPNSMGDAFAMGVRAVGWGFGVGCS
jgi:hypothetical protein